MNEVSGKGLPRAETWRSGHELWTRKGALLPPEVGGRGLDESKAGNREGVESSALVVLSGYHSRNREVKKHRRFNHGSLSGECRLIRECHTKIK